MVTVVGRHVEHDSRTVPVRIDVRNAANVAPPWHVRDGRPFRLARSGDTHPHSAGRGRATRSERMVRLPANRTRARSRFAASAVVVISAVKSKSSLDFAPANDIVVDGAFLLKAQAEKGEGDHDEH